MTFAAFCWSYLVKQIVNVKFSPRVEKMQKGRKKYTVKLASSYHPGLLWLTGCLTALLAMQLGQGITKLFQLLSCLSWFCLFLIFISYILYSCFLTAKDITKTKKIKKKSYANTWIVFGVTLMWQHTFRFCFFFLFLSFSQKYENC